jgi:hypothetical protein
VVVDAVHVVAFATAFANSVEAAVPTTRITKVNMWRLATRTPNRPTTPSLPAITSIVLLVNNVAVAVSVAVVDAVEMARVVAVAVLIVTAARIRRA